MKMYVVYKTINGKKCVFNGFRSTGRMSIEPQFTEVQKTENLQAVLITPSQLDEMLNDLGNDDSLDIKEVTI